MHFEEVGFFFYLCSMDFSDRIFSIQGQEAFEKLAVDLANFQLIHCEVYREFCHLLGCKEITHYDEILFLPISFFKSNVVISKGVQEDCTLFLSSGTENSIRSKHYVSDLSLYEKSYLHSFRLQFGDPSEWVILALLPNYLEQGDSSLIYMVEGLIQRSASARSGFLLGQLEEVHKRYLDAVNEGKKCMIFGVSYALWDLADLNLDFSGATVIETGGMKGRREELTKAELHHRLKQGLNLDRIYSEYGMTELLSQAYGHSEDLVFSTPPWMRIKIRDLSDPFSYVQPGQRGGVNVIDLANINSCCFIATQDVGRLSGEGFQLEGRMADADVRGCNQMVE